MAHDADTHAIVLAFSYRLRDARTASRLTQDRLARRSGVHHTDIARAYALFVLTLEGDHISAITWFADSSVFAQFGLPRMLPDRAR